MVDGGDRGDDVGVEGDDNGDEQQAKDLQA